MKRILLMLALGQMDSVARILRDLDADKKGADDVFGGIILPSGSRAMSLFLDGKIKESDAVLDQIIDGLCQYRGREIPPPAVAPVADDNPAPKL